MSKQTQCFKLTFEAIQEVRKELAEASAKGETLAISEILLRLSNLYASIDANEFLRLMNEMENQENVIRVNFKKAA